MHISFPKILKNFSIPFVISVFVLDINPLLNKVKANNNIKAANADDLALYQNMGLSYVCSATRKGIDLDASKAMSVASSTFVTVVMKKHDGMILEGKKQEEKKVDPKVLYENVFFRLIGGALEICPDNVPEKMKKEFKEEVKRIEKLIKN